MRIRRLKLPNFRSVAEGEVVFPGHTVIIGGNSVGKSTLCEDRGAAGSRTGALPGRGNTTGRPGISSTSPGRGWRSSTMRRCSPRIRRARLGRKNRASTSPRARATGRSTVPGSVSSIGLRTSMSSPGTRKCGNRSWITGRPSTSNARLATNNPNTGTPAMGSVDYGREERVIGKKRLRRVTDSPMPD